MRRARLAPPGGAPWLVALVSAAMCFIATVAWEAASGAGRIAGAWETALEGRATVRVPAPEGRAEAAPAVEAALEALRLSPGVISARALDEAETAALVAPWLGPEVPVEALPLPVVIEVETGPALVDLPAVGRRVAAAAPGATLDDHASWAEPMEEAARRFRALALWAVGLTGAALAAVVALAARASMARAREAVATLRLVGAEDGFVAAVFDRPIALRALVGGLVGAAAATAALMRGPAFGLVEGLGAAAAGGDWRPVLVAPLAAAVVAFLTARLSVLSLLKRSP